MKVLLKEEYRDGTLHDTSLLRTIICCENISKIECIFCDDGKIWLEDNDDGGYSQGKHELFFCPLCGEKIEYEVVSTKRFKTVVIEKESVVINRSTQLVEE